MTYETAPFADPLGSPSDFEEHGQGNNIPVNFWTEVMCYLCVAAALHAVLVSLLFALLQIGIVLLRSGSVGQIPTETIMFAGAFLLSALFSSVFAAIAAILAGFITVGVVSVVFWSLEADSRKLYLAGFVGGLTAYICSFPLYGSMLIVMFGMQGMSYRMSAFSILLFTLATIMGQAAGVMGARRAHLKAGRWLSSYTLPHMPRFQIKHMLWITFWLALFLGVLRAVSLFSPLFWAITGTWLMAQCFSLVAVLNFLERRELKLLNEL